MWQYLLHIKEYKKVVKKQIKMRSNMGWRVWTVWWILVLSDIQNYFECITKKHETLTHKLPVEKYVNKIQNRVTFKNKCRYYLELLTSFPKIIWGCWRKITKVKYCGNIELVLVHWNITNSKYQRDSRVLSIFVPINHLVSY